MSTQPVNPGAPVPPSILGIKTSKNGHSKKKSSAPAVPVESVQPEPEPVKETQDQLPTFKSSRDPIAKSMRESKIENIADELQNKLTPDATVEFLNQVIEHLFSDSIGRTPSELIRCFNEVAARYEPEEAKEAENNPALMELEKNVTWRRILSQIENAKYYIDCRLDRIKTISIKYPERLNPDLSQAAAEISTLHDLMVDWSSGSFDDEYPNELPLIATIRGNLDL